MPLIFWRGSWQRWHSSRLRIGTTVRRMVPPGFQPHGWIPPFRRIAMAGLAGGRISENHPALPGLLEYRFTPLRSSTTSCSTRACLPNASIICAIRVRSISHHLMFKGGAHQFAFGQRRAVRNLQKAPKMTDRKDVGGGRAGGDDRRRNTEREANRHAAEANFMLTPDGRHDAHPGSGVKN